MEENKIKKPYSKSRLRGLVQYKDKTEEEFNEIYNRVVFDTTRDEVIAEKYNRLMSQFEKEYDLSELLPNDRVVLKNLINAMLQLEDYETFLSKVSKEGISSTNIITVKELNTICKNLRGDISEMQDDLGITRKIRKTDKEQSAIMALEEMKKKAAQFYEQKMQYVFCEKCGALLSTVWWLNPADKKNKIIVHCTKPDENEQPCGWTGTFLAKDLLDKRQSNRIDLLPESMR